MLNNYLTMKNISYIVQYKLQYNAKFKMPFTGRTTKKVFKKT